MFSHTHLTTIPRFFHQPPENLPSQQPKNHPQITVPVIDLSQDRSKVVEQIRRRAASSLGFFQIVNHNIPLTLINSVLNDNKKFYEQSTEYKMKYYQREKEAKYSTNYDLYQSKAASWRDTIEVWMPYNESAWEAVPEMCRAAFADWDKAVVGLAEELMSILCEGMGIKSDKLKEELCLDRRLSLSHYYPQCPQPELTLGLTSHTDPCVLTVLVQNEVGGLLQIKCGEDWVNVDPVPGAIVINIGDLLQIMSNDEYKSVEHRVLANTEEGARVSIAVLFTPSNLEKIYGPFPELIYDEKPAVYNDFIYSEFIKRFEIKELAGKRKTDFCRIDNTNKG